MAIFNIAMIPGDGIGPEVLKEGIKIVRERYGGGRVSILGGEEIRDAH